MTWSVLSPSGVLASEYRLTGIMYAVHNLSIDHRQWSATEADDATRIHQQKLRVVYLPTEGEPIPEDTLEHPSIMTSEGDASVRIVSAVLACSFFIEVTHT